MPRRIQAGGSTHMSSPVRDAQRDRPTSPPPAEQEGASTSSTLPSPLPAGGKALAEQLHAQFMEENQKKVAGKTAEEWWMKLRRKGSIPMEVLVTRLGMSLDTEFKNWKELENKFIEYLQEGPTNEEQTQKLKEYLTKLAPIRAALKEALDDYDKNMPGVTSEAKACLAEFEALSQETKDDLFRTQKEKENLGAVVTKIKRYLLCHLGKKTNALYTMNDIETVIDTVSQGELKLKHNAVEHKMLFEREFSSDVRRDADEVIDEYGRLFEHAKRVVAIQAQAVEDCDMLLGWKNLDVLDKDDTEFKENFCVDTKYFMYKGPHLHSILSFFGITNNLVGRLRLLLPLVMHDNNVQQDNGNLRNWYACIEPLIYTDFPIFEAEFDAVMPREDHLINGKDNAGNSREALSIGLQLVRQGQSQLEKMLRTCEASMEEYENLEGIVKDERVTSLMKALAESITGLIRSRERSMQIWLDKLERWEDFLPPELQTHRFWQQQLQAQPSWSQNMHKTDDGIVVGQIENGKLERLGDKGNVIDIHFKDDSGNWVKDYGDEPESEPAPEQLASVAVTDQTVKSNKSVQLMERVGRIVDLSIQFSKEIQDKVAVIDASGIDYMEKLDKKIDSFSHVLSNQSKAINKVIDILSELMVMQDKDVTEEGPIAIVKDHLKCLKEDRKSLHSQWDQVRHEKNIHSHKSRDPNEANLMFLWKEGQVESVKKEFGERRQNQAEGKENDWLERYTVSIKPGPQGDEYASWIVHAHYGSNDSGAEPERVHMKRDAEKDWGVDMKPYHSPPLNLKAFDWVKEEAQKQVAPSGKSRRRRRR